jgi:hypothetical protein
VAGDWRIAGTYLEACNCDPICPCRRIAGVPGGRSTHGLCLGVLSWHIASGQADGVGLAGLDVVLACRYSDDEPGSPWDYALYLDERTDQPQHDALAQIYTGRAGGSALLHFPWAWKPSRLLGIRRAAITLEHGRRGSIRADDIVHVRTAGPVEDQPIVTCVIPGHHRTGEEVATDELRVANELDFEFAGVCGFRSDFDYSSDEEPAAGG